MTGRRGKLQRTVCWSLLVMRMLYDPYLAGLQPAGPSNMRVVELLRAAKHLLSDRKRLASGPNPPMVGRCFGC
jgi:hypothetical protein